MIYLHLRQIFLPQNRHRLLFLTKFKSFTYILSDIQQKTHAETAEMFHSDSH